MDFIRLIKKHVIDPVHRDAAIRWWQRLSDEATLRGTKSFHAALYNNIAKSRLFPEDSTCRNDIQAFCQGLIASTPVDSMEDAKEAIENSGVMIYLGPDAQKFGSEACSLVGISSFVTHCTGRARGPISIALVNRVWDQLADINEYSSIIDGTKLLRGSLPLRFWVDKNDIDNLGDPTNVSSLRLGQYLGLIWSDRSLLITISLGEEISSKVPTGWDGFDNQHFRENLDYDPSDRSTHFGYTLDIKNNKKGAKEVVSMPIALADTKLERRYA